MAGLILEGIWPLVFLGPWLFGLTSACLGLAITAKVRATNPPAEEWLLHAGASSAIALIATGWFLSLGATDQASGIRLLTGIVSVPLGLAVTAVCLRCPHRAKFRPISISRCDRVFVAGLLLLGLSFATHIYVLIYNPVFGWDVIDFWAPAAIAQVEPHHLSVVAEGFSGHPLTTSALAAPITFGSEFKSQGGLNIICLGLIASLFAIVLGYSQALARAWSVAIFATLIATSLPLIQNHIFGFGYAEIALTVILHIAIIYLARFIDRRSWSDFFIGLFSASLCVATKDSGIIYAGVALLAFVIVSLWSVSKFTGSQKITATVFLIIIVPYLAADQWAIASPVGKLGWDIDLGRIWIAGKRLAFFSPDIYKVVNNLSYQLFVNSSFGISTITFLILLCFSLQHNLEKQDQYIYFSVFIFLILSIITQFTTYGFTRGQVGNDTSGSRAILVFLSIYVYAIPIMYSRARSVPATAP